LYNYLLENCINKEEVGFKEINELYKNYRYSHNLTIQSKSAQNTSRNLINAIKSFYAKKKKDKTAEFPYKFKGWQYFTTFILDYNNGNGGFKIKNNTLIVNLNCLQNKLIVNLPDCCSIINENNIKTISLKKEDNDYYICFTYSTGKINRIFDEEDLNKSNFVSIDLGYSNLVTCFSDTINNFSISNYRQKKLNKAISNIQSIKDKKKKNSIRYKKYNKTQRKLKKKLVNKQKDFQHKLSKKLVNYFKENNIETIILGDLKVKKVQKEENHKINGLSKSTASIARFKTFLEYKSKNEDMNFIKVDEYNTSKTNFLTNEIYENMDLSIRNVKINDSLMIDRDLNAAINIAKIKMGECLPQFIIQNKKYELYKMYVSEKNKTLMYE